MQFQQVKDSFGNVLGNIIARIDQNGITYIPNESANRDWQEYQAWLAAGNTPEPAP